MSKRRKPQQGKSKGKHRGRAPKKAAQSESRRRKKEGRAGGKPQGGGKSFRGKVQKNPRGFAFIVPANAEFEDAFVSPDEAVGLSDGDVVEFQFQHRAGRTSAKIIQVLQRRTNRVIGKVVPDGIDLAITTETNEYYQLGKDKAGVKPGDYVVAEIEERPTDRRPGKAQIMESFGKFLSPKNDIPFTVARYGLRDSFSQSLLRDADRYRKLAEEEFDNTDYRKDQRDLNYVTIDGEDAKDFDDAIYVESTREGFILYVSIADVSFFVRPGTELDKEARARATSVYFPGFCLPMLPEFLSNELCSLRPQEDKLALTAEIHFSPDGEVTDSHFYSSTIKTARRLTYTQVQAFFDRDEATLKDLAPIAPHLKSALQLYRKLEAQRRWRGVLEFNLPESKIVVDKEGRPTSVAKAPRYISHKLIEEFMIAANRAVAKELRETKSLALYRVHEAPDADKLDNLNMLLKNLGSSTRITEVKPRAFAKVLEATTELKSATTLHHAILRLQKQAKYMPQPKGHFGLALNDYAHFTSPIRRYPDLVVHRALKALTSSHEKTDKRSEDVSLDDYVRLGEHTSDMERRATEAERFIVRRKQCWYFADRIGDVFDGTVAGVTKNGLFVNLGEMAAEGFVPMEFMDGNYEFDEGRMCLRQRPGNVTLSLGDPFKVQVMKVNVEENQITLGAVKKEK